MAENAAHLNSRGSQPIIAAPQAAHVKDSPKVPVVSQPTAGPNMHVGQTTVPQTKAGHPRGGANGDNACSRFCSVLCLGCCDSGARCCTAEGCCDCGGCDCGGCMC